MGILREMKYQPDVLARSLASKHPLRVAVLLPFHTPENWFWKEPLNGIQDACSELEHFRIEVKEFLYNQFEKSEFQERAGEVLAYAPDAVIAAPVFNQETRDFFDRCSEAGIPFVSLNDNIRHPGQVTYVGQDSRRSGAVAGYLMKTGMSGLGKLLVISIAGDRDNYNHILNREQGFKEYFEASDGEPVPVIISRAMQKDSYAYIRRALGELLDRHREIQGIFVTNSRVYQVARFLFNTGRKDIILVGYDLIKPNIKYLNNGTISFLISQKPREQGYKAMISVFNALKLNRQPSPEQHISIDIICRENLSCYRV